MEYEKKLIEGKFPCQEVGAETRRERDTGKAPPTHRLHVWWARRPLTPSRAAVLGSILPADTDPELFLRELGIKKYQINIKGNKVDIPKSYIAENGLSIHLDDSLIKLLNQENKLRAELREIIDTLLKEDPSLSENEKIIVLQQRSTNIDFSDISPFETITVSEISADPAGFNELMAICSQYDIRIPNLYGYDRAYANSPSAEFQDITVLDPTAGGGSIPFEAMRLGCKVIANDLNPVSAGILYSTLRYPTLYGFDLTKAITYYGKELVSTVSEKMFSAFYKSDEEIASNDEKITSYLYCRTVTCPNCGERAPLLNAFALSKKVDGWMVLPQIEGIRGHKKVRFVPVRLKNGKGPNGEDPEKGTCENGVGTCLHCGQAIASDEIKRQACGTSQYGRWSDDLYCVVAVREQPKLDSSGRPMVYASGPDRGKVRTEKVSFFREPTAADFDALKRAEAALRAGWDHWDAMDLIPTEKIPEGHKTAEPRNVGIERWCDMFTPRQLLGHLTAMETLHDMIPGILAEHGQEKGTAIITYLQYMIDKCIDYNSKQTRWHYSRGVMVGSFGRHDFSLKWTFGELIYTGQNSGLAWGMSQVIDAYEGVAELLTERASKQIKVLNGSAANLDVESSSVDVICIDPPYYNNVQYAELSDYFYVWQKRTFKTLYPDVFDRRLTNKSDEAVANPVRDGSAEKADRVYEKLMGEIFAECRRVLKDDGVMTMMFTHKTQEAWETLTRALIENGWIISSSFPVDSESSVSIHQKDMAAAQSSIFLACRKRDLEEKAPSAWSGFGGTGVIQQLRGAVRQSLKDYESLNLNAVDEMVASYGSALKVLSENWPVMDGDELVSPIKAMREASTIVAQYQMTRLTNGRLSVEDLAPEAGIALTLFGIYGNGWLPFDDALSLSRSLNIRLESRVAGYHDEDRMIGINDERTGRVRSDDETEGYYAPLSKRGSKLRLVLPEERNPRRLQNPQNEWDVMQGVIMAYREGDIPVARAYLQRQAEGHEEKIIGVLTVWADGCGSEELSKEARRILYGLK
jgi:putative DNA methylase